MCVKSGPIHFLVLTGLIMLLSSCGALIQNKAKNYATVEAGAIPQDFGEDGAGVVFLTYERSHNKYLKKNVRKVFRGPHIFLPLNAADSLRNAVGGYRYLFGYDGRYGQRYSSNTVIYGPGGGMNTYRVRRFYLRDLKTDSTYTLGMMSGFWSKLQRYYLKKLEEQRLTHQD